VHVSTRLDAVPASWSQEFLDVALGSRYYVVTRHVAPERMRWLYRLLLHLHDPGFRDEMLRLQDDLARERRDPGFLCRELVGLIPAPLWTAGLTTLLSVAVLSQAGGPDLQRGSRVLTNGPLERSAQLKGPCAMEPLENPLEPSWNCGVEHEWNRPLDFMERRSTKY
jgi:hypothetical protein